MAPRLSASGQFHAWRKASLQPATLICLLIVVFLWVAINAVLRFERQQTLDAAIAQGGNMARLFEESTVSMLRGVDRTLLLLAHEYDADAAHFDLNHRAMWASVPDESSMHLAIVDETGHAKTLVASGATLATAYVGDSPWFSTQRFATEDRLVISAPKLGRLTGRWTIVLSRRVHKPGGGFAGVISAGVDLEFIEQFYKSVDLGAHGSVILRNLDGVILASAGTSGPTNGRRVMQPALQQALAKSPTGYYWGGGAVDGINRLVSYRVSPHLPVITMVGRAEGDIFANYRHTRTIFLFAGAGLTLILLLGAAVGARHQLRLTRSAKARRQAEMNMAHARKFLDTVIENLPLPVIVKDADTLEIELVNDAYETFIGMSREQLIGKTVRTVYAAEEAETVIKLDREAAASQKQIIVAEFPLHTPNKGLRVVATTRLVVHEGPAGSSHLITVIDDVTDRRATDSKIFYMAHHDDLTGLANRAAVTQEIVTAAARHDRYGEPFTVLLLDLDRFKYVNDTLGHPAGDALLRAVALRLKSFLRETDVLARLGGDEFAIIQRGEADPREAARVLAGRIIEWFTEPFNIDGNELNIGTSIGIALAPEHATDPDSLLKMADMALYRAKSAGRNGFRFFDTEMSEAAHMRHELENELRRAVQKNELELHYQPIINTRSRKICAAEALVRWRHPVKGLIAPGHFIPLAEETGLITQIGEWVLRAACAEAVTWPANIKLAVNLSPVQFRKSNLSDVVMSVLAETGLSADRLEFEITETALIESATECLPTLHQFKDVGITVALDDFGTGYSSFSQLTIFPFDRIKIDRSFTKNMITHSDSAAIISATVTLAQGLDIETTAEGVETAEQYELLRLAGVTQQQGYLFKRPGPACEIDFDAACDLPGIADAA
ncbi:MAG TPA: EAL domain-containing protein [Pseudolabrys sp.]|nr:EAL domain-containing protein [Pseudolabrys sp.]